VNGDATAGCGSWLPIHCNLSQSPVVLLELYGTSMILDPTTSAVDATARSPKPADARAPARSAAAAAAAAFDILLLPLFG